MARKTAPVQQILDHANRALSHHAEGNTPEYRQGVAAVLETVLMDTGNYQGFRYTDGAHGAHDDTRRFYYGEQADASYVRAPKAPTGLA